ncbi:ABC transporter permease [bacterium]|nr:ABC transporter permease [bacterium]
MSIHQNEVGLQPVRGLLRLVLSGDDFLEKSGDMDEVFGLIKEERGAFYASYWYWLQIMKAVPVFGMVKLYWRFVMWRNYLKSIWRNIKRNKTYSALNIAGLAIGMSCSLALFLVVHEQLTYDNYHDNADRVYRVSETIETATAVRHYAPIAWPLGPVLREKFPQIESLVRIYGFGSHLIKKDNKSFYEENFYFAEKDLFNVLTFQFLQGDPATALEQPNTIVLTESIAHKYFGDEDAMGQTLIRNTREYIVTGIVKDSPRNTHLKYNFIASLETIKNDNWMANWYGTETYTYLKLRPNVDVEAFQQQIRRIGDEYVGGSWASGEKLHLFLLQPIADIHLHSKLRYEIEAHGNLSMVRLLIGIGVLVLLVSCMNYINLATARSVTRAKEVGLRKIVGASRNELIRQFWSDSLFMAFVTMIFSMGLLAVALPFFNRLAGTAFGATDLLQPATLAAVVIIIGICGVGAGIYPSILLSSYQPSNIMKGAATRGRSGAVVRKVMVVFQFMISILLAVSTLVIFNQIDFMKSQYPGFDKNQKLVIPVRGGASIKENYSEVKDALLRHSSIIEAAASSSVPGRATGNYSVSLINETDDRSQGMYHIHVDEDFVPLYQIKMIAGRNYISGMQTDISNWERRESGGFLINEAAMKALGISSAEAIVGKQLKTGAGGRIGPIIGVTTDFHFKGLQNAVEPLIMEYFTPQLRKISLTVNTMELGSVMDHIKKIWTGFFPETPLETYFLDADFDSLYIAEEQLGGVAGTFTVMGLIVACLGLLGLSAFTAAQRTKEIGIRKTLGASISSILVLLCRDYVRWILVANILVGPLAWVLMRHWLQDFAVRAPITIIPFVLTGVGTLVAALFAVSIQSYRAAVVNPTRSLKQE